jgi:hypothetical protein
MRSRRGGAEWTILGWSKGLADSIVNQNRLLSVVNSVPLLDIVDRCKAIPPGTVRIAETVPWDLTALAVQPEIVQSSVLDLLEDLDQRWSEIAEASSRLHVDLGPQLSTLAFQVEHLSRLQIPSYEVPQFGALMSQAVIESLERLRQVVVVGFEPTLTVLQAFQTANQFGAFALSQINRARERPAVAEASAAITAHLESYLTAANSSLEALLSDRSADGQSEQESERALSYAKVRRVNLFGFANRELAWAYRGGSRELDYGRAVSETRSAKCSELGMAICRTLYEINQSRQLAGKDKPFRLGTDRALLVASQLPVVLADSEQSFADVVDRLFFLVYEASGNTKYLRNDHSGQADELLKIKFLRHYFRHDQEAQDSWKTATSRVAGFFDMLIGKCRPSKPREWMIAQLNLYVWLLNILLSILDECQSPAHAGEIE